MISKELLSEVLGKGKGSITKIEYNQSKTIVEYEQLERYWNSINIHQLAHKCKEWAFNKGGIDITSGKRLGLDGWECLVFIGVIPCDCYESDTEPEAIFKACQWILSNR